MTPSPVTLTDVPLLTYMRRNFPVLVLFRVILKRRDIPVSTSGVKSDITFVSSDLDFL